MDEKDAEFQIIKKDHTKDPFGFSFSLTNGNITAKITLTSNDGLLKLAKVIYEILIENGIDCHMEFINNKPPLKDKPIKRRA